MNSKTNSIIGKYNPSEIEAKWPRKGLASSRRLPASRSRGASLRGKQEYNPSLIELKWQKKWEETKIYSPNLDTAKKPFYNLMMFPYPSAEGLHVGNMYAFTGVDVYGRFQRMQGNDVFEPIGLDGFGIHSENYAIKAGTHPVEQAKVSEKNFYKQFHAIGNSFDWSRTVESYKPEYYKWTQWLFIQLFKAGLAYRKKAPVNFCPSCKTVLSDEQVLEGLCERCDSTVEKRDLEQWFFKITKYADRLLNGLSQIDWDERVKTAQKQWIGKSEGMIINFGGIDVFTTRPETADGATFLVLSPQHPKVKTFKSKEVADYVEASSKKTNQEKQKEKIGVFSGEYVVNPLTKKEIPVWVADYVLMDYGAGAIMAVPAEDERDREFAEKYKIPIEKTSFAAKPEGKKITNYHLRDWLISRQRYWGPPIPMIYCEKCAKKPKILLIHGIGGNNKENWFPWFKKEMERKGYEVLIPDLPHTNRPAMSEWLLALGKLGIRKENRLFIVGHSLGAPVACQFVKQEKLRVEKMIFVAPTGRAQGSKNWENLRNAGLDENGIKIISDFNSQNTGLSTIKTLIDKTVLYFSDNDPYIPSETQNDYRDLNPEIKMFTKKGHFNASAGITQFPEILDEFPKFSEMLGWQPVPEKDLPVLLPFIKDFKPLGTGKAPLANHPEFYKTKCPKCGGEAKRETDVSDTFLDSAWYFLRYVSTDIDTTAFDRDRVKKWLPVNMYIGGAEHSVLHLLYARFITMALKDMGHISFEEPFAKFRVNGLLVKDGAKMSKSKGNVVIPDEYIKKYGADTLRMYLMFMGPFDQGGDFRDTGTEGMSKFLRRVWNLVFGQLGNWAIGLAPNNLRTQNPSNLREMHKTIKKVTEDIEELSYNTAIAALMEWYNYLSEKLKVKNEKLSRGEIENFLKLLAPFAPHISEELYQLLNEKKEFSSINTSIWPVWDPKFLMKDEVVIVVQVNGKLRGNIRVKSEKLKAKSFVEGLAKKDLNVTKYLEAREIKKVIYVEGKIINFVVA